MVKNKAWSLIDDKQRFYEFNNFIFSRKTARVGWLFEVLGLVVGGEEMELKLMAETHYCGSLFYNMRNIVP